MRWIQIRDESGATATEYAIMCTMITVVIVGSVTLFGGHVQALFAPLINRL